MRSATIPIGGVDHNLTCAGKNFMKTIIEDNDLTEIDIKNSQFTIHAYWMKEAGLCVNEDVQRYYDMCKNGTLYEEIGISLGIERDSAKQLMFEMVFSHHKFNTSSKKMFKRNYPNVMKHIDEFKKEKKNSGLFSVELQQLEAEIVIDNLYPNIKELGVFCLTKHDSIIIKRKDRDIVMKVITSYFNELCFECALNVDDEIVFIGDKSQTQELKIDETDKVVTGDVLDAQNLDQIKNAAHYKAEPVLTEEEQRFEAVDESGISTNQQSIQANNPEEEMKKKYTVDELLKPKEAVNQPAPTKLQHLKIGEGAAKKDDINRTVKEIQEQDEDEEKEQPSMSNKEIYDLVVEVLKADGHLITKQNVDYLTKIVKEEMNKKDTGKREPSPPEYKYVNPYVKRPA